MSREKIRIITPQEQIASLQQIRDFEDYKDHYREVFPYGGILWTEEVHKSLLLGSVPNPSQAYFKFLTFLNYLFLQNDYESMSGQMFRRQRTWKEPQAGARHQLSVASYGGSINTQTFPYKTEWSAQLQEKFPNAAKAVWGLSFTVSRGKITPPTCSFAKILELGTRRYYSRKPIYMPNSSLNKQLADLNFSSADAENMDHKQLTGDILPKAIKTFNGIIDLSEVFQT